jgi:hypothetical protein
MDMSVATSDDEVILSPLGQRDDQPRYSLAKRLDGIAGRKIGLLDNSKQNATAFLDEVAALLRQRGVSETVYRLKISAATSAGDTIRELAETCDAVINAYGDCGSCTSWCVHDSIDIERLGVPVATVNSIEFVALGKFEAGSLGMPDLPIVVLPHPVGSLAESKVREYARAAFEDVVAVLTGGSIDSSAGYRRALARAPSEVNPPVRAAASADAPLCGCDV